MRKRLTPDEVDTFLRRYGRKKRNSNWDPNDRNYSRPHEELIKRMDSRDLDALMRGEDDDAPAEDLKEEM